jgi:ketosteroid isomerase-like protein
MSDVEQRLRRLEDERAILDTLYAYGHSIDYGLRDVWDDCWTEDAVLHWPHESYEGREAIGATFEQHSHAPDRYHKHLLVEPRIQVDGDRATVESYFARLDASPEGPFLRSFGRYLDVLARGDDGRWRLQERRAERESLIPGAPVT